MTQQINTFYMCIDMGDLVYSLLFSKILNVKNLLIDGGCSSVKFNWNSANFIMPLIEFQNYIESVNLYSGQKYDYNYSDHPNNHIVSIGTDLTKYHASKFNLEKDSRIYNPWLTAPKNHESSLGKKIVINRTNRYHGNNQFYYDFLKYFHPDFLLFLGLEEEYLAFKKEFGLDIDYIKTNDILDLASIIDGIPFFVGNESLICAIAKGLGKTCYVEYCPMAANYIFYRPTITYF